MFTKRSGLGSLFGVFNAHSFRVRDSLAQNDSWGILRSATWGMVFVVTSKTIQKVSWCTVSSKRNKNFSIISTWNYKRPLSQYITSASGRQILAEMLRQTHGPSAPRWWEKFHECYHHENLLSKAETAILVMLPQRLQAANISTDAAYIKKIKFNLMTNRLMKIFVRVDLDVFAANIFGGDSLQQTSSQHLRRRFFRKKVN